MAFPAVDVGFPDLRDPAEYVRLAREAERLGFDGIWVQEGTGWGALPLAALILAATERVIVGTGIVSPFKRHPESLASDAAVLSAISGGRFVLGLGSAASALASFAPDLPQLTGLREAVEIVRRLFAGESFTYPGRVFSYRLPRPLGVPVTHRPPIVLGAMGPRMVKLAAEVADGILISRRGGSSPRYVRQIVDAIAATRGGRPDRFGVRCFFETALDSSRDRAFDTMRGVFVDYTLPHLHRGVLDATEVAWSELQPFVDALRRGDTQAARAIPADVLTRLAVVGTPDDCLGKLAGFQGLGIDVAILYLHGRDVDRSLRMAADLLPALRGPA